VHFQYANRSVTSWSTYYATLKDDSEDDGDDLLGETSSQGGNESGDDELRDELIDKKAVHDHETRHKQLDADRRAKKEKELQALVQRFAASYQQGDVSARRTRQVEAAVRREREQAESALRAEEERERERIEAWKKRKHEALCALYAAYEDGGAANGIAPPTSTAAQTPAELLRPENDGEPGGMPGGKKRFHIAKKTKI